MVKIHYITTCKSCKDAVENILFNGPTTIAMACKSLCFESKGDITLIALSTSQKEVYIFDVKVNKNLMMDGGLWRLIESNQLLKVYHDCRSDSKALKRQFGVSLAHVFDTQAAYCVLMQGQGLPGRLISLVDIYDKFGDLDQIYKKELMEKSEDNGLYWARRPVSKEMMNAVTMEVLALVPSVFENINRKLEPNMLPFVEKLSKLYLNEKSSRKNIVELDKMPQKKAAKWSVIHLDQEQRKYLKNTIPKAVGNG